MAITALTSSPRTYRVHRERQRRRILAAARKLFDERGIDRVTMAEVISASELRPSTIYEYFSGKDDIVWAILEEALADVTERVKLAVSGAKTGWDKIKAMLELMADDLVTKQESVRFMAQFDAMYARHWPVERLLTLEAQVCPGGFQQFTALVREGIAEGSLRSDLNPALTLHAVMNAVVGAQRRLASLGSRVELEYGHPIDSLFRETIRILLLGMRAT